MLNKQLVVPCNITHSPTCVGGFEEFPLDGVVNSDTAAAIVAAVGVHLHVVRFSAVQCGSSAIRTFLGRRTNHQLDTFRQDEDTGFGDVQDRTRPI